jgi:acetyl/propionyl-CoA carboxylase alpha subunit
MKIKTVAVYSEADRDALHVRMADEAYFIGAPPSSESYLRWEKILDAAKKSAPKRFIRGTVFCRKTRNSSASVPNHGSLSSDLRRMRWKRWAEKCRAQNRDCSGRSVVPGTTEPLALLKKLANGGEFGYPVMLKASAGGGGKECGSSKRADLKNALEAAQSEAEASFGDSAVYVEKSDCSPRHYRDSGFSDKHG